MSSDGERPGLDQLVVNQEIVVCCGPGGVGKTTIAASLALECARRGRRACVVTIDPARRLANALGLSEVGNAPSRIEGDWPGELWALMLDTKSTFDALVVRHAATSEQAEAILQNRLYRNISGMLSGTHEYMAMEKLYELHHQGRSPEEPSGDDAPRFDLVVVDTPPTRNALDFVDAPRRLTHLLDNRVFRLLMVPTRAYLRAVSVATQAFLRTISKVVGAEVVTDVVAFFRAFEGMEEGFRRRAQQVDDLINSNATAFVLVASPARDAVREAAFFADRLAEAGIPTSALVVNRVHPRFDADGADVGSEDGLGAGDSGTAPAELAPFYANLAEFTHIAGREESHFAALAARVAPAPVSRVPFLPADVHDLAGLRAVSDELFVRSGREAPRP